MKKLVLITLILLSGQTLLAQGSPGRYEFSEIINDCIKSEQSPSNYKGDGSFTISNSNNVDDDPSAPPQNFFSLCQPSSGSYQNTSVIPFNPDSANDFCEGGIKIYKGYIFNVKGMRHGQSAYYTNVNNHSKGYAKVRYTCNSTNNLQLADFESIAFDDLYCGSGKYSVQGNRKTGGDTSQEGYKSDFPRLVILPKIKLNDTFEKEFIYNNNKYKVMINCTDDQTYRIDSFNSLDIAKNSTSKKYIAKIKNPEKSCDFSKITKRSWSDTRNINGFERTLSCYSDTKYIVYDPNTNYSEKIILTAKSKESYNKSFESIEDVKKNIDKTYGYQILSCDNGIISVDESFCTTYSISDSNGLSCDNGSGSVDGLSFSQRLTNINNNITSNGLQIRSENSSQNVFFTASDFCLGAQISCSINDRTKQTTTGTVNLGGKTVSCSEI